MAEPRCPVIMPRSSKRVGEVCGRRIRGFVAPGEGRCEKHCTLSERDRVREERASRPPLVFAEVDADGWTWDDVDRFVAMDD